MSGKSCGWSSRAAAAIEPGAQRLCLAEELLSWGWRIAAEDPKIPSIGLIVWTGKNGVCDEMAKGANRTLEDER